MRSRLFIRISKNFRLRPIDKDNRTVGAGFHRAEPCKAIVRPILHGMAHPENEPVDRSGSLDFAQSSVAQQTAQNAVVPFHQFREHDALSRLLDEKSPQLRNDEPFVRLYIFGQNGQ